jgi:4-amino-4-deoxy-L-arabinose transferase-like glycosyltransferase
MLRTLLLILAFVVLLGIVLVWANIIDVNWNREAQSPVTVDVNPVHVGTTTTNMQIETPTIQVQDQTPPPGNSQ